MCSCCAAEGSGGGPGGDCAAAIPAGRGGGRRGKEVCGGGGPRGGLRHPRHPCLAGSASRRRCIEGESARFCFSGSWSIKNMFRRKTALAHFGMVNYVQSTLRIYILHLQMWTKQRMNIFSLQPRLLVNCFLFMIVWPISHLSRLPFNGLYLVSSVEARTTYHIDIIVHAFLNHEDL